MSVSVHIQLTPQAQAIAAGFKTLPARALQAVAKAMNQANQLAIGKIKSERLTGQGPFPVEQHKLGRRSGRLRGSVWAAPAVISGDTIISAIGSPVKYAAVHEFGADFPSRPSRAKIRTQKGIRNLAKFGQDYFKTLHPDTKAWSMPARAPFQAGIRDTAPVYQTKISAALLAALKN